jgi:hypothetical protein
MFRLSGVSQGLSPAEAALNFQRNIAEFGPIYISFMVTSTWKKWNWDDKPVYTGGGHNIGGHAVLGVGWGVHEDTKYWLLRNSWGPNFGENGYFKFERGVNLDNVELEAATSMATKNYADWSLPYCTLDGTPFNYDGSCSQFDVSFTITCNKDASLKIFSSYPTSQGYIRDGGTVMGSTIEADADAMVQITTSAFDAAEMGYGKQAATMWVQIKADDGSGNVGDTEHFITFPKTCK